MDTKSFYTRHMLLQYGRQLISSRRLSRYHQLLGIDARRDDQQSPELQRQLMVDRISREVVDNLIFAGSDNPVVLEVKQRLNDSAGEKYTFKYPPGELDFRIFRESPAGLVELSSNEKHQVMGKLLDITRETVAETML